MAEYTTIPEEYKLNYNSWFTLDKIKNEYNGDIFKAMEDSPILFAYWGFGIKLRYDQIYESDIMFDSKKLITISARQRGKTFIRQILALWAVFYNKVPQGVDKSTKVVVISMDALEAMRYISEIRNIMVLGDAHIKKLFKGKFGEHYFTDRIPKKGMVNTPANNQQSLPIYSDGVWNTIKTFPPNNSARGKPASILIMDEVAIWDYIGNGIPAKEIYYEIINPMKLTAPNCRYWVTSTPKKPAGLFYDLCPIDGHNSDYKMLWLPYHIVDDETYQKNAEEDRKMYIANGEYDRFRQEYLAEFVDVGDSFFDEDTHTQKVFDDTLDMHKHFSNRVRAGLDFGGSKNSHTVITIVYYDEKTNECIRIYHKRYPVGKDSTLKEDVKDIAQRYNIECWYIDSQGAGSSFYDWFNNEFGAKQVKEFVFAKDKRDMYNQFRIACYRGKIKSYIDKELMREFRAFTPDYKPMKGETDDLLDSFAMACFDWILPDKSYGGADKLKGILNNPVRESKFSFFTKKSNSVRQIRWS